MATTRLSHVFKGSTRVDKGWYDPDARKVTLQFPDRVRWAYYHVAPHTWEGLVRADSPGRYVREVLDRHQNGPAGR